MRSAGHGGVTAAPQTLLPFSVACRIILVGRARITRLADAAFQGPIKQLGNRASAARAATTLGHWTGDRLAVRGGWPSASPHPTPTYDERDDYEYDAMARGDANKPTSIVAALMGGCIGEDIMRQVEANSPTADGQARRRRRHRPTRRARRRGPGGARATRGSGRGRSPGVVSDVARLMRPLPVDNAVAASVGNMARAAASIVAVVGVTAPNVAAVIVVIVVKPTVGVTAPSVGVAAANVAVIVVRVIAG